MEGKEREWEQLNSESLSVSDLIAQVWHENQSLKFDMQTLFVIIETNKCNI